MTIIQVDLLQQKIKINSVIMNQQSKIRKRPEKIFHRVLN